MNFIKINNNEKAAIKDKKWKNPGAKLYNQILDSMYCEGNIPTDSKDIDDFGRLLHETWQLKRQTGNNITTGSIDELYNKGIEAGALGGKLLGAGGGGFLLFYVKDEDKENIRKALSSLMEVPFKFEDKGAQIIYNEPEVYIKKGNL